MSNFENLNDINSFTHFSEIDTSDISSVTLIKMLYKMILIRKAEEKISDNVENGVIKCPCHLAIGQEQQLQNARVQFWTAALLAQQAHLLPCH